MDEIMDEAFITGDVLRWARERRSLSQTELAAILKVRESQIDDWEHGRTSPLYGTAEKIASKLKVPFGYFFLSARPPDDVPLPDLRTLTDLAPRVLSLDAIEQINSILRKQDWYREYSKFENRGEVPFVGSFAVDNDAEAVAASIRDTLTINAAMRRQCHTWDAYLSKLIARGEANGILVIRSGIVKMSTRRALSLDDFRGFASSDSLAPLVFINGQDSIAARVFTLVHEYAHIWINASGISNTDGVDEQATIPVERFCNKVATEVLVPMREFNAAWEQFKLLPTRVERLAAAFRVSGRVVVRRALELGKVSRTEFYDMMDAAKAREQPRLKRKGGNPDTNLAARNSTILIDKVVRAVHRNHIEYRDAGRVLGVSVDTISKLAKR